MYCRLSGSDLGLFAMSPEPAQPPCRRGASPLHHAKLDYEQSILVPILGDIAGMIITEPKHEGDDFCFVFVRRIETQWESIIFVRLDVSFRLMKPADDIVIIWSE